MSVFANRFAGRRAVVTGASGGIGRAAALRLAAEGAKVGLVAIDEAGLERVRAEIAAAGGEALALVADVSVEAEIEAAIDRAAAAWGGLDIVVANAGIELLGQDDRVDRLQKSVWDRLIAVNLTGQFLTSQARRPAPPCRRRRRDRLHSARTAPISAWRRTSRPTAPARAASSP